MTKREKAGRWRRVDYDVLPAYVGENDRHRAEQNVYWYPDVEGGVRGNKHDGHGARTWDMGAGDFTALLRELPEGARVSMFRGCDGDSDVSYSFYTKRPLKEDELDAIRDALEKRDALAGQREREEFDKLLARHPDWGGNPSRTADVGQGAR